MVSVYDQDAYEQEVKRVLSGGTKKTMPIDQKELDGESPEEAFEKEGMGPKWWAERLKLLSEHAQPHKTQLDAVVTVGKARGWLQDKVEHEVGGNLCELVVKTLAETRKNKSKKEDESNGNNIPD